MDPDLFIQAQSPTQPGPNSPDPSGKATPSIVIPDHQLLRRIGRGSYGEVWLARNMTGMYRAVKIVYRQSFETQRPFDRELSGIHRFEPISRSHEGFVDVLHVGIKPGEYFYYVMELGDDETRGQQINPVDYSPKTLAKGIALAGKLSFDDCLKLGLALTQALAELHKHNLVHRDVKPSNIIFVHGVPKLADIGLVADTKEARSYVGTEGFIPPEGPGTPGADVYGIGKVLYECSMGKDRHDFPELPTRLDEFPEHAKLLELNEIILRACKTEAKERYRSAWEMYSDLVVLANGKSVKRLKFLERRLAAAKRIASLSAAALLILTAVLYQVYRERRAYIDARQREIGADVANGNNALNAGDISGALPYFAEVLALHKSTANERNDRFRFASVLAQCPALVQMWFGSKLIFAADFSPDGRHILILQSLGRAQIFDIQTGRAASPQFGQADGLRGGSFSPDGSLVVTDSEDQTARVWRASDGVEMLKLKHPNKVLDANFSPDGKHIVTGCRDGIARIWNSHSGEVPEKIFIGHTDAILCATFSHNGEMIATTSRDGTVRIWSVATGRQIGPPLEHFNWVNSAAFSPDDHELATGCYDHKARVWEVASGRKIPPEMSHDDGVNSVQYSPDGRFIITAGYDRTARLWLAADHRPFDTNPILWHGDRVTYAGFARDGHQIVTTCTDGTVRIWDLAGGEVAPLPGRRVFSEDMQRYATIDGGNIQTWDASSQQACSPRFDSKLPLREAKLSAGGNFFLAVSLPETPDNLRAAVEIFDTATGRPSAIPFSISGAFTNFSLSRDGQRLLAVAGTNVQTWSARSGIPLSPLMSLPVTNAASARFSPDGNQVALWGGNQVEIRDAVSGARRCPALIHQVGVERVEFSPDGSHLVTCCSDIYFTKCSAQVWETATGRAVGTPLQHADGVLSASFSPDGCRVVTASEDYTAVVWDANSGRQLTPPLRHKDYVRAAVFSPDGKWIATASSDKTARIWSADNGEPLSPPLRHVSKLTGVKFLPDGKHLLTSNKAGESWIWNLSSEVKPIGDLQKLSCLLTSGVIGSAGASGFAGPNLLKPLWEKLRTNYPAQFTVDTNQIAAWHEFEAEQGEADKHWYSTAFHSQRRLDICVGEELALARLDRAKSHLLEQGQPPPESVASHK